MSFGWVSLETVGIAVGNTRAVSKLSIFGNKSDKEITASDFGLPEYEVDWGKIAHKQVKLRRQYEMLYRNRGLI